MIFRNNSAYIVKFVTLGTRIQALGRVKYGHIVKMSWYFIIFSSVGDKLALLLFCLKCPVVKFTAYEAEADTSVNFIFWSPVHCMLKLLKLAVCVLCTLYLYMKLNIIKVLPLKACRFLLANCLDFWARVYSSEFWPPPPPISLNRIEAKEVTIKGVLDKTKWSLKWTHETLWHLSLRPIVLIWSSRSVGILY